MYVLPAYVFSPQTPYASATAWSVSASSVNGSSYFDLNFSCDASPSGLTPSTTAPALLELAPGVADPARLGRAAGRVILGVKIQYDR